MTTATLSRNDPASPSVRHRPWPRKAFSARLLRGALWAVIAAPLVLHLAVLPEYGRLQRDDYYGVLNRLADGGGLSSDPADWWRARINYHRVTVPALIWGANVRLFDGHNLPTGLFGLACLVAIALVLARRVPSAAAPEAAAAGAPGRAPPEARLLPAAIASVLVLQPIVGHNLAKSFSGVHTFLAVLLAVAGMAVLERRAAPEPGPIWPLFPLAVLGPLTFSSELAAWPALIAGALALRVRGRDLTLVVAAAAAAVAVYLTGRPVRPPVELPDAWLVLRYVGAFLGAPLTGDDAAARVVGWLLLAGGAAATAAAFARGVRTRLPAFWLMVQLYALGNGVLAALGRGAAFGEAGGASVRYGIYPALFLLATAAQAIGATRRRRRRAAWLVAAAVALAAVPIYQRGLWAMEVMVGQGRRQPVAELGLRLGLDDTWYLGLISPNPRGLVRTLPALRALGHVPFDRQPLRLPGPPAIAPLADAGREVGRIARIGATLDPDLLYVAGWLERAEGAGGEVLFLDAEGRRASAISVYRPLDEPGTLRWEGFALRQGDEGPGTAYLRRAADGRLVPLGISRRARTHLDRLNAERSEARTGAGDPAEDRAAVSP